MATIGKVNNIRSAHDIEWKISNFPSLFGKNGNCYCSPSFRFADEYWHLKIYPNGQESNVSNGCVSFYLARRYPGRSIRLKYVLGLKTVNGERDSEENCEYVFKETDKGFGLQCILRSKLFERRSELLPNDVLTVFCNLQYSNTAETPSKYYIYSSLNN